MTQPLRETSSCHPLRKRATLTLPLVNGPGRMFVLTAGRGRDGGEAAQRRGDHWAEEIIGKLREAEGLMAKGGSVADAAKAIGVTEQSYYRWRRE